MDITPHKRSIVDLVGEAREGMIVLPQFQRTFVWGYSEVQDLLVSILKGYFIGTFLVQRCDRENLPFAIRTIEGVEIPENYLHPEFMVLDGQQRLTTLHYVLFNPPGVCLKNTKYPYRFFLKLDEVVKDELEEAIYGEKETRTEAGFEEEWQFKNREIPFSVLQSFQTWDAWLDRYQDWLRDQSREEFNDFSERIRPIWKKTVGKLFESVVPVIEIPKVKNNDQQGIAETCAIFEKMNSTGVDLSVFDLLTARLYKDKIDLHALWKKTIDGCDLIKAYSEAKANPYGVFILRCITLMRGMDVKSKIIINLSPEGFEEQWDIASGYVEKALQRITSTNQDGFGVFDEKWMPYPPMAVAMAMMLWQIDEKRLDAGAYAALKKWYWGSVFDERYQSAVESTTVKDYNDWLKHVTGKTEGPDIFKEIDNDITHNPNFSLEDVFRINAKYKGVMNLLALRGARDFHLNDSIEFHSLDDHHIFPKNFLTKQKTEDEKRKYQDREVNVILNKTLISATTNRKITNKAPSVYIIEEEVVSQRDRDAIFRAHFINAAALQAMKEDDYESFLKERDKEMTGAIKALLQL